LALLLGPGVGVGPLGVGVGDVLGVGVGDVLGVGVGEMLGVGVGDVLGVGVGDVLGVGVGEMLGVGVGDVLGVGVGDAPPTSANEEFPPVVGVKATDPVKFPVVSPLLSFTHLKVSAAVPLSGVVAF
jgi:hypothetical protein